MKILLATLVLLLLLVSLPAHAQPSVWQPSPGHTQIAICPGIVPDALLAAGAETFTETDGLQNVSIPTMTVYSPKGKNSGVAVVFFSGGGYRILAIDLEGTEVCDWLTSTY